MKPPCEAKGVRPSNYIDRSVAPAPRQAIGRNVAGGSGAFKKNPGEFFEIVSTLTETGVAGQRSRAEGRLGRADTGPAGNWPCAIHVGSAVSLRNYWF